MAFNHHNAKAGGKTQVENAYLVHAEGPAEAGHEALQVVLCWYHHNVAGDAGGWRSKAEHGCDVGVLRVGQRRNHGKQGSLVRCKGCATSCVAEHCRVSTFLQDACGEKEPVTDKTPTRAISNHVTHTMEHHNNNFA